MPAKRVKIPSGEKVTPRLMEGAKEVKCSELGTAIVKNMESL